MAVVLLYNNELTLLSYEIGEDEIGNETKLETKETVFCRLSNVGQSERYNAAINDLKLEIKFIIHNFEYSGQKEVEFEGVKHKVTSTVDGAYSNSRYLDFDEIELTCEKVIGSGR